MHVEMIAYFLELRATGVGGLALGVAPAKTG